MVRKREKHTFYVHGWNTRVFLGALKRNFREENASRHVTILVLIKVLQTYSTAFHKS